MKSPRISAENIQTLKAHEIFVFGSNTAGAHGKGAAYFASRSLGAKWGKGEGHYGYTYAIPTKDAHIETLPLRTIERSVERFIGYATLHPKLNFLVTEIGCGLAGYQPVDIAPMFKEALDLENVYLPKRFHDVLKTL